MAQPPVDQAVTNIHSIHARRAALEQHIRKATRRCADIERDQPGRIEREAIERMGQLVAAAAGVGQRLDQLDRRILSDLLAGFGTLRAGHPHCAGQDQRLGLAARFGQPALNQQLIEPNFMLCHNRS